MKLSIIIPVYNVAVFLPETIQSVLAQDLQDFELILVDDGATDGSGDICDRFAQMDPRVRVIHQANAGVSAARNAGLEAARGEFIGWVDSDDIIEKDMYAVMLSLAEKYGAQIVQCEHDRLSTLNGAARGSAAITLDGPAFVRRIFTKQGGRYTNQVALWSKIYKKELLDDIRFPVGQTFEDDQQVYKVCLKADTIVDIPDILYHYIKRENSIITGVSPKKLLDRQAALLDRLLYLPVVLPDLEEECARSFFICSAQNLCQLQKMGAQKELAVAQARLVSQKKRLAPWISRYDRLYIPALKWPWARKWILQNEFEPLQKWLQKIKGR